MEFCKENCGFNYRFYNYALAKYYGIGKGELSYRDLLFGFLNVNWEFLPSDTVGTTESNTVFVGQILLSSTIVPIPEDPTKFYENDQAAFDDGVAKNAIYYLSQNNTYGSPFGTPKKLVEDVE